jgi:PhnB protein
LKGNRLQSQLKKKENMKSDLITETESPTKSIGRKARPVPEGMHAVTPHLVCAGAADAIEFYKKAFNAVELARLPAPDGKLMHAMIRIGDSAVMLVDESREWGMLGPKSLKGSPVTIHLYVEDVDAVCAQAVRAGAKITMPIQDMFWGDRYGKLEDPFGHQWSLATHIRDVSSEELKQATAEMCG